jgi:hypothetical protein
VFESTSIFIQHKVRRRLPVRPYETLTDGNVDAHVNLGILNRLQDQRSLVAVGSVKTDTRCKLGKKLDVSGDVGLSGAASGYERNMV